MLMIGYLFNINNISSTWNHKLIGIYYISVSILVGISSIIISIYIRIEI